MKIESDSVMYPQLALLIDGKWHTGGGREEQTVINPATCAVAGVLPLASMADVDQAADAADRAFTLWRAETALTRARVLLRVAEFLRRDAKTIARALTIDQGKPLHEAEAEVFASADIFEWSAEEGKRVYGRIVPSRFGLADQYVFREPVGPVAAFSPWNFPLLLASRKIATALAAGCTIVIKPPEETPGALVALGKICGEAGLTPGALNILFGNPADVSERLIKNPLIKKVSFTGSVPVGRCLAALAGTEMKKITLELGGHSPVIIMPDVDVTKVAELSVAAKFRNAGQICFAPSRFIVHQDSYEVFGAAFAARASALRVGNGLNDGTQMGPLANERRVAAMQKMTDDARTRGGRIICGGEPVRTTQAGYFWSPTIIADVPNEADLMVREPFGPIAPITSFQHLEDAVERANAVEYGLGSYAFTNSATAARYIQRHIQAGSLSINTFALSPPELPFAGVKQSGLGVEMGIEGLAEHFNTKSVIWADMN